MECADLKLITKFVGDWLYKQPNVNENTLTEYLLYMISKSIRGVYYKTFSQKDEGLKTGADWQWWIIFKDGSYKMRVQAKKEIDRTFDFYRKSPKASTHQLNMLISDAQKGNYIPFYSLYSTTDLGTLCPFSKKGEGVYLASAYRIKEIIDSSGNYKQSSDDIVKNSLLLSCFFCCNLLRTRKVTDFDAFVKRFYPEIAFNNIDEEILSNSRLGFYKNLPNYIMLFMERYSDPTLNDWYTSEFRDELADIGGLVVLDLR